MKSFLPLLTGALLFLGACNSQPTPPAAVSEEVTESKAEALAEHKLEAGQKIYEANCAGCHDAEVAGAPKPGDKAAWKDRIAQGVEVMTKKSIEGFAGKAGIMQPKGGNDMLTNEEVTNAVVFMVEKSK
ncbi:MAG: cytochrome c5 family protein [Chlorobium sp.]|nr:MAG: cytochrome c5 family protein [Chlorobium sp.]